MYKILNREKNLAEFKTEMQCIISHKYFYSNLKTFISDTHCVFESNKHTNRYSYKKEAYTSKYKV